ncbi:MAG: GIY-YIG nuclease family protein [Terricaulis sp.]
MTCGDHAFVYVLGSARGSDRRTYVGWCADLEQRLTAHNSGKGARSTRGRVWVILYAERHPTRRDAMSREVYLKRDRAFRAALAKLMDA